MSWECYPLNYLSHDLLHPSDDEGLPFLHWELKQRTSLFLQKNQLVQPPLQKKSQPVQPPLQKKAQPVHPPLQMKSQPVHPPLQKKAQPVQPPLQKKAQTVQPPLQKKAQPVQPPLQKKAQSVQPPVQKKSVQSPGCNIYYLSKDFGILFKVGAFRKACTDSKTREISEVEPTEKLIGGNQPQMDELNAELTRKIQSDLHLRRTDRDILSHKGESLVQ